MVAKNKPRAPPLPRHPPPPRQQPPRQQPRAADLQELELSEVLCGDGGDGGMGGALILAMVCAKGVWCGGAGVVCVGFTHLRKGSRHAMSFAPKLATSS